MLQPLVHEVHNALVMRLGSTLRFCLTFVMLIFVGCPQPYAWADWSEAGAQYACDSKSTVFEVLPYDTSSSDPPEGVPLKKGFRQIKSANIRCILGSFQLRAKIYVFPPAARGECMGGGFVRAESITVKEVELLPDAPAFNFDCHGGNRVLVKIRVAAKGSALVVERCYAPSGSSNDADAVKCESSSIDINARAAAQAQEAHQLADLHTQSATSAVRLPPDNDFANVFRSAGKTSPDTPLCAHMSTVSFMSLPDDLLTMPFYSRHARVAGVPGDRIFIHLANPQVCDSNVDAQCGGKAYLVPGDRVNLGFICGKWALVEYPPANNTRHAIDGWVETGKLYDVDSLIEADPERWVAYWTKAPANHPVNKLVDAAARHDAKLVRTLVASPSGFAPADLMKAFAIAIEGQDEVTVDALLTSHIDLKANCKPLIDRAATTSDAVLSTLVRAGLDLSCDPDELVILAGLDRIQDAQFRRDMWHSWMPMRDLSTRIQRMLSANIPVNAATRCGKTALLATVAPNNVDVARVLLQAGANPNVILQPNPNCTDAYSGMTALIQAVNRYEVYRDPSMVQVLLDGGADPNYLTTGQYSNDPDRPDIFGGVTALHMAAEQGYLTIVKTLLEHNADPRIARSDGALPLNIAKSNGHLEVARLIEAYLSRTSTRQ